MCWLGAGGRLPKPGNEIGGLRTKLDRRLSLCPARDRHACPCPCPARNRGWPKSDCQPRWTTAHKHA
eukprot:4872035-Pyramimonas_sp.AAC.1